MLVVQTILLAGCVSLKIETCTHGGKDLSDVCVYKRRTYEVEPLYLELASCLSPVDYALALQACSEGRAFSGVCVYREKFLYCEDGSVVFPENAIGYTCFTSYTYSRFLRYCQE